MVEKTPPFIITENILDLFDNSEFLSALTSINNEYAYWDRVKYKAKVLSIDPVDAWNAVKISRRSNRNHISFGTYHFRFSSTDYIQRALHYFDMNIGGYLSSQGLIPEKSKNQYMISSIMEEAISSSKIEGANTTRKKAKEMLRREEKPHNKSEQMIVNNYLTIKHIVQNKSDELSIDKLLQIHGLISKNTLDKTEEEGFFRDTNDIFVINTSTSEIVHTPPSHEEIPGLIKDLCVFFNQDNEPFIHPIIKAIIIHFMIGWVHPFTDGNGRTARALFYWYLLKKGYWMAEYLSISRIIQDRKNQYEKAYLYTENDENDLSYFITFNLKAMELAFDALKTYLKRKQIEARDLRKFIKIPEINERQTQLLELFSEEPEIVLNVKEVQNRFSVSNYTARADLMKLVRFGFLEDIPVNKTKVNFVKSSNFESLVNQRD